MSYHRNFEDENYTDDWTITDYAFERDSVNIYHVLPEISERGKTVTAIAVCQGENRLSSWVDRAELKKVILELFPELLDTDKVENREALSYLVIP